MNLKLKRNFPAKISRPTKILMHKVKGINIGKWV